MRRVGAVHAAVLWIVSLSLAGVVAFGVVPRVVEFIRSRDQAKLEEAQAAEERQALLVKKEEEARGMVLASKEDAKEWFIDRFKVAPTAIWFKDLDRYLSPEIDEGERKDLLRVAKEFVIDGWRLPRQVKFSELDDTRFFAMNGGRYVVDGDVEVEIIGSMRRVGVLVTIDAEGPKWVCKSIERYERPLPEPVRRPLIAR